MAAHETVHGAVVPENAPPVRGEFETLETTGGVVSAVAVQVFVAVGEAFHAAS